MQPAVHDIVCVGASPVVFEFRLRISSAWREGLYMCAAYKHANMTVHAHGGHGMQLPVMCLWCQLQHGQPRLEDISLIGFTLLHGKAGSMCFVLNTTVQ